jgi:UDP-N-acetyl-D-glucosamine dehydrogenase
VEDIRESPGLRIIQLLEQRGAIADFHDPYVSVIPLTRETPELAGRRSVVLDRERLGNCDAVLICTDHQVVDYRLVTENAGLVIDTRNACRACSDVAGKVVKA